MIFVTFLVYVRGITANLKKFYFKNYSNLSIIWKSKLIYKKSLFNYSAQKCIYDPISKNVNSNSSAPI